jgi:hypothetical protein
MLNETGGRVLRPLSSGLQRRPPVDYFFAFIAGRGKVDLIARDSNGEVLEKQRI